MPYPVGLAKHPVGLAKHPVGLAKHLSWMVIVGLVGGVYVGAAQASTSFNQIPEPPVVFQDHDQAVFQNLVDYAIQTQLHQKPLGLILQSLASQLQGAPYQAWSLDQSLTEQLVISLTQFDCMTFIEVVWAMARGVAIQDYSMETFTDRLQAQRYRAGQINGYCSRLHYYTDWINQNQRHGHLSFPLSGSTISKHLNFMSQHRDFYPALRSNDPNFQCITQLESSRSVSVISYIPTAEISSFYDQLQPGDLVGLVTSVPGLDVTHTGLIYKSEGSIGYIHASPMGQVIVSNDLASYVQQVPKAIGITVARALDPSTSSVATKN